MLLTKEKLDQVRMALELGDDARAMDLLCERTFQTPDSTAASELVEELDAAVKLAAKAMTGGYISREDGATLSRLCKLIGHEP